MIRVRVAGIPVPQGSMRAFVRGGHAQLTSDNTKLRPWRDALTWSIREARAGRVMAGPVVVLAMFAVPRPRSHFGKAGLRPSAPRHPSTRPDVDKLLRAVLDAATASGAWRDDAQVTIVRAAKVYAGDDGPGADIWIWELGAGDAQVAP